jgi:hypothetical protein
MPKLANFKPYAFSASKFIEYHKDNSLLRSQGLLFLLFVLILTVFMIMIAVNKYKNNDKLKQIRWLRVVIQRIKYRNITDLFCIVSLPLLIFSFNLKFTNSQIADIIASIVIIILVVGFVILASYILMTAKTLE